MLLFLLILPLDYSHRQLQPFVALANANGATVEESLLVDYVARLPVSVTIAAGTSTSLATPIFLSICSSCGSRVLPCVHR